MATNPPSNGNQFVLYAKNRAPENRCAFCSQYTSPKNQTTFLGGQKYRMDRRVDWLSVGFVKIAWADKKKPPTLCNRRRFKQSIFNFPSKSILPQRN